MFTNRQKATRLKLVTALALPLLFAAGTVSSANSSTAVPSGDNIIAPNSTEVRQGFGLQISGRKVSVQPGVCWINDHLVQLKQARQMELPPCPPQVITDDPVTFAKGPAGVMIGVLPGCDAAPMVKTGAPDVLIAGTLILKPEAGRNSKPFIKGKDYNVNSNGVITRVKGGALEKRNKCFADYSINKQRVDTLAVDESGRVWLAPGKTVSWAALPPAIPKNYLPLFNIYNYSAHGLTAEDVLGVSGEPPPLLLTSQRDKNHEILADVFAKLKEGKPVTIAFWGDAVTAGAGASSPDKAYPQLLTAMVQRKYPKSEITADIQGAVNTNSGIRSQTFFQDVLHKSPDLVIFEFANDVFIDGKSLSDKYVQLIKACKIVKSDVLIILPPLPPTSFIPEVGLNGNGSKVYTEAIRNMLKSETNAVGCDIAARSEHLSKEGLKRESIFVDGIDPSDKGHQIYAEELFKFFQ